jgi:hypothetical protein
MAPARQPLVVWSVGQRRRTEGTGVRRRNDGGEHPLLAAVS